MKVSVRVTVTSTGYVALSVTDVVDCVPAVAVAGKPVKLRAGAAGKTTVSVNVSVAVSPSLSVTLMVIDEVVSAAGVPLKVPVELMVTPVGNPVAAHV